MNDLPRLLQIDPSAVTMAAEDRIQVKLKDLHREGAVIGLSGGLDSAVAAALTVRALGADMVHTIYMPEQDSKRIHRNHARQMAAHLGTRLVIKRISPILRAAGTYRLLPLRFMPAGRLRAWLVVFAKSILFANGDDTMLTQRLRYDGNTWLAKGNAYAIAKHRARMMVIYQYAEVNNLMVVGAANRSEWLTGTFSKWGVDHCADIMPLLGLYRSQLEGIAAYLQIPAFIRSKPADPDVMPGVTDKGVLLGDFQIVDQILHGIENQESQEAMSLQYDPQIVEKVFTLWELSRHMRESPYS